jgi:polar amino acid transport system substrate-binding protein
MKQWKLFSALTVVVMLLALLAACAQPAQPAPAAAPKAEAPKPTEAAKPAEAPKATEAPKPAAAPAAKKFMIASDASFPPMEFVDESKKIVGFDIDLINAIAKDQKFEVEIKNTAWDGIFAGLEAGQYDAILSSVTVTDERQQKYDFSNPYFDANQGIVVRADDSAIKTEADLSGKTVGVQIETTGAIAVRKITGAKLKQFDTPDLAMLDLLNKNVDAVVVDTPVAAGYALQSEQFKGKLKLASEIVTNETYGLTVQKKDPSRCWRSSTPA